MAANLAFVISSELGSAAMPEWVSELVFLVRGLSTQGVFEMLEQPGPVRRSDSADLTSIFLFLLAFFCCGGKGGLRGFGDRLFRWRSRLAALTGRKTLPSSSAVSRGLAALDAAQLRRLQSALLLASMQDTPLLNHALTAWHDAHGQPWCVVDLDPTVQALRQRALPEGEDLPDPKRRADGVAAPGYPGRKRGEVILSACRTQFSGSALWCSLALEPGNTAMACAVQAAVADVHNACKVAGVPTERTIMRIDGAGGNVPCVTVLQASGLRYITRSAR